LPGDHRTWGDELRIRKVETASRRYSFKQLMAGVTKQNIHGEVRTGPCSWERESVSKRKYVPRRGDVISLDFDPQKGHEQAGRRPALVLSPTEYNKTVGLVRGLSDHQ